MQSIVANADALRPTEQPLRSWLSAPERLAFSQLRDPRRRESWLTSRWLLKRMLACDWPGVALDRIEIVSRGHEKLSIAPRVYVDKVPSRVRATVSHAAGYVMAAIAHTPYTRIGCDLAPVTTAPACWLDYWLTPAERALRERLGPTSDGLVWALKECLFKALGEGRRFRPYAWDVATLLERLGLTLDGEAGRGEGRSESEFAGLRVVRRPGAIGVCLGVKPTAHVFRRR